MAIRSGAGRAVWKVLVRYNHMLKIGRIEAKRRSLWRRSWRLLGWWLWYCNGGHHVQVTCYQTRLCDIVYLVGGRSGLWNDLTTRCSRWPLGWLSQERPAVLHWCCNAAAIKIEYFHIAASTRIGREVSVMSDQLFPSIVNIRTLGTRFIPLDWCKLILA